MKAIPKSARINALSLLYIAILLAGGAPTAHGQFPALDGFNPNANGLIRVVVLQPDGKILIGGSFTALVPVTGSVTRNRIARLNPDGTLDTAFNPNANDQVYSMVVQADGKIVVSGLFTNIGGLTRSRIARLDATTGLADSFDPNASDLVMRVALQPDGRILAGGSFTNIGGQTRNRIARLDPGTGLADSFDPNANNAIQSIVMQADGKLLVGGFFTSINGQTRNRIARLDPTTGLVDSFNPNASGTVQTIAVQADGKILAGGNFNGANSIGGQTRNFLARLDPATGLADSFNPNPSGGVAIQTIALQADGRILVTGSFTNIGGLARTNIARLSPTTGLADSFSANADLNGSSIAVQPDGKILVSGNFTSIGGVTRNRIARLETDGRLDQTLNLGMPRVIGHNIHATAIQPDGKILIGGRFRNVLGVERNNIARLNTDGTLDTAFNPNAAAFNIYSIVVQADGQILVGGEFQSIGGQPRNGIARLNATTGLAESFNPNASGVPQTAVFSIVLQADGKIIVGGIFTNIGGQARVDLARLDATTGLADSFDANTRGYVGSIAVQTDGKILVGGRFTNIGGQARNGIARLDPATGLADSFDPNASDIVQAVAVQADGRILVGGGFTNIGGQTRNFIARLDATTGAADSFNPSANAGVASIVIQADDRILVSGEFTAIGGQSRNRIARLTPGNSFADAFNPNAENTVWSLAVQADGKVLAGGEFIGPGNSIGGQDRNFFARLKTDTIALQNLAVTPTAITWTRGGASPQLTRVTFESSTDNVNYTALGNGTAAASNWTRTGLSLPIGQNLYIRARGYYRSGYQNGSESITESVRNAFLVDLPLGITSIRRLGGGEIFLEGTGSSNTDYTIQRSLTDPAAASFSDLGALSANSSGIWHFTDTSAAGLPRAFYRASFP